MAVAVQPPTVSDPPVLHRPAKGGKGEAGKTNPGRRKTPLPRWETCGKWTERPVAWMAGQAVIKDSPTLQR